MKKWLIVGTALLFLPFFTGYLSMAKPPFQLECELVQHVWGQCYLAGQCWQGLIELNNAGSYAYIPFDRFTNRSFDFIPLGSIKIRVICYYPLLEFSREFSPRTKFEVGYVAKETNFQLIYPEGCYWLRSTYAGEKPSLEINVYANDCVPERLIRQSYIKLERYVPFSTGCFCPNKPFVLAQRGEVVTVQEIKVETQGYVKFVLKPGWNLLFNPSKEPLQVERVAKLCKLTPVRIKGELSRAWSYDPLEKEFKPVQSLEMGKAAWVYARRTCELELRDEVELDKLELKPGWNMVGGIEASCDELASICKLSRWETKYGSGCYWWYNPEAKSWVLSEVAEKFKGYWVRCLAEA